MHYAELLKGVNAYASDGKNSEDAFPANPHGQEEIGKCFYSELVVDGKSCNKLAEDIEYLLMKWNQRVPVDEIKLRKTVKQVANKVKTWDLVKMNLWNYHKEITEIFRIFVNTAKPDKNGKQKKNYTSASKALHILNPKFFVMWDYKIRDGYGCCENEEGYFNFLLRCQKEIEKIISTYESDYPSGPEISQKIYEGPPKSIVKLLDEYNIAKYTKEWLTSNEEKDTTSIIREMREKSYDF